MTRIVLGINKEVRGMKKLTGIIIGAILVACGAVYILNVFGIVDISISLDGWWALFIIVPSISGLVLGKDRLWNLFCLLLGIYLFLAARDVIAYAVGFKLAVPIIIVMLGVKLIMKSVSSSTAASDDRTSDG